MPRTALVKVLGTFACLRDLDLVTSQQMTRVISQMTRFFLSPLKIGCLLTPDSSHDSNSSIHYSYPAEEILCSPQNIVGQFKPASAHNSTWLRMREKEKERAKVEQEKKNAGNGLLLLLLLSPLPLSCIITFLLPPLHLRLSFSHDPRQAGRHTQSWE